MNRAPTGGPVLHPRCSSHGADAGRGTPLQALQEIAMLLGIIGWIVVGLVVGFVASKVVNLRGDDPLPGIGVAAAVAVVSGALYSIISGNGVTAWNPWGLLFAVLGAGAGAAVWHVVRSRYSS